MTASATRTATGPSQSDRRRWIALVIVCLGQLMIVLDSTIVNVALPAIQRELHFNQANLTWVVNAYLITFGSFLLMAGRLGDLIGRKKMFLAGLVLFTLASAVCGLAADQAVLVVARFVQGLGGAMASSVILAIIVTEFPGTHDRAKAMSVYMFVVTSGGSIGLLAGGLLTQSIDWHWIFYINLPIGIAALVLGNALIVENEGIGIRQGVDVLGSVLVTVALMLGVYAIVQSAEHGWGSAQTLGWGAASAVLLSAFFVLESRIANPIMPLRILRLRSLVHTSLVRAILITGMFSAFFFGALYLEHVLGYSPLRTGLAFLPLTLSIGVLSLGIVARLVMRFGPKRVLIAGLVTIIAGLLLLASGGEHARYFPHLFFAFVLIGLGAGTSFMPLLTMAMSEVPKRDAGLASGIVNVSMQVAAAVGLAVLGTIATAHTKALLARGHSELAALTSGYQLAFVIGAACVVFGLLVSIFVLRAPVGRGEAEAAPGGELAKQPA